MNSNFISKTLFDHNDYKIVRDMPLSIKAKCLFYVLFEMRSYQFDTCNPSYATLKIRTGIKNDNTISAAIKELVDNKVICYRNKWRKNSKKKTSNIYKLLKQT